MFNKRTKVLKGPRVRFRNLVIKRLIKSSSTVNLKGCNLEEYKGFLFADSDDCLKEYLKKKEHDMKQPSCNKKIVVYYETILPMLKEIQEVCNRYDIEHIALFRTDECGDEEPENVTDLMVSYSLPREMSTITLREFIAVLTGVQRSRRKM